MWQKFCNFLFNQKLIINILFWLSLASLVYNTHIPWLLGSKIDREYINNIDIDFLIEKCSELDDSPRSDENGVETYFFDKRFEDGYVYMLVDIYPENEFSNKWKVKKGWRAIKRLWEFDTVITLQKDNVEIQIVEQTKKPFSKRSQMFLGEILS